MPKTGGKAKPKRKPPRQKSGQSAVKQKPRQSAQPKTNRGVSKGSQAAATAFGKLFAKQTKESRAALKVARAAEARENVRLRKVLKSKLSAVQARADKAAAKARAEYERKRAAFTKALAAKEAAKRAQRVAASAIARASKQNRRPRDRLATQDREKLKDRTNRILLPLAERKMQRLKSQASRERFQTELEFAIKILTEKAAKGPRSIKYLDYRRVSRFLASLGFDGITISQLYGSEPL